jgi:hypothetical protein
MPKVNTALTQLLSQNERVAPTLVRIGPCCLFVRGDLRALRGPAMQRPEQVSKTIAAPPTTDLTTNDNSDPPTTHDNHMTRHMNN